MFTYDQCMHPAKTDGRFPCSIGDHCAEQKQVEDAEDEEISKDEEEEKREEIALVELVAALVVLALFVMVTAAACLQMGFQGRGNCTHFAAYVSTDRLCFGNCDASGC